MLSIAYAIGVLCVLGCTSQECIIPQHPLNGKHSSSEAFCQLGQLTPECRSEPGTKVPDGWFLLVGCHDGFVLDNGERGSSQSSCVRGEWRPMLASCVYSVTEEFHKCTTPPYPRNGKYKPLATECALSKQYSEDLVRPGTFVPSACVLQYSCDEGYLLAKDDVIAICERGAWNPKNITCPRDPNAVFERPLDTPLSLKGGCTLPEHPQHGSYVSALCSRRDQRAACRNIPGTQVPPGWSLKYTCDDTYDLSSSGDAHSVCENGVWSGPLTCIKLCPPLQSLSVDVKCSLGGQDVPCDQKMKPNTRATAKCKQHYEFTHKPRYSSLLCKNDGEWTNPLFYCDPVCGVQTKADVLSPQIKYGTVSHQGEFPWLAALYNMKNGRWVQNCGGTLISSHIILTAAHCLFQNGVRIQPQDIKVGLGKYYSDFYRHENFSVIADVREIVTPNTYFGENTLFVMDIALLDLTFSVQVTAYIMPACVDWTYTYNINPGDVGHVAGWGTTETGKSSETVLSTQLTYVDFASCVMKLRHTLRRFVTNDKFCAGTTNVTDSQVDKGDSGGGLTFVKDDGQHFVFGVVSTKITEGTMISLFTDIRFTDHHNWLDNNTVRLDLEHLES